MEDLFFLCVYMLALLSNKLSRSYLVKLMTKYLYMSGNFKNFKRLQLLCIFLPKYLFCACVKLLGYGR